MNAIDQNYQVRILSQYHFDLEDGNIDVEVKFDSGQRFVATFFTLKNIKRLMGQYQSTGECKNGAYFWASDMIIVETLSEQNINSAVADLIAEQNFNDAFYGPSVDSE
jgi:hypothetical protein